VTLERDDDIRLTDAEARGADDADSEEVEVAEIRTEIEETRLEMGGTLNELGERLEPGHLMNEAKENVREATIGRVEETAKGMSDMVMETIKRNPIPAAMAGAGLALLWANRSNSSGEGNGNGNGHQRRYAYDGTASPYGQRGQDGGIGSRAGEALGGAGENVGNAVGQAGETAQQVAGDVIERGQQTAQQVGWRLERFMQASPLAVGAIAVGAGALVGALVPETEQEREILGDASREVGTAARDLVDDAGQQAEQALDETERSLSSSDASR